MLFYKLFKKNNKKKTDIEQLICITQICGTPSGDDLASIGSEQAQKFVKSLEDRKPVPLRAVYPKATQPGM